MTRTGRRAASLLVAAAACGTLSVGVAPAAKADVVQVTVTDKAEAWYGGAPVANCSSPVGCPPVSAPPAYPANTLHVGEVGGSESARTYVELDLSTLVGGESVLSGTLTLPVSSDSSAGNVNVATATPILCLAAAPFPDGVSGSSDAPPGTDCSVQVAAAYHAATSGSSTAMFTADLSRFFASWHAGTPNFGIAVLPAPNEAPNTAWHVAFNGRQVTGAAHIGATLLVSTGVNTDSGAVAPVSQAPASTSGPAAPSAVTAPAAPAASAPVVAALNPLASPVAKGLPLPSRTGPLPWPFLWFPLALAVVAAYAIRVFTRPVFDGRHHGHA